MKRILSIDGGGIRGIIPAVILTELEKRMGGILYHYFDLIAGTSTGSILATGIANCAPYSCQAMVNLYKQKGSSIFSNTAWNFVKTAGGLYGPKYPATNLTNILSAYFGTKLSQCRTKLLVPSYNVSKQQAWFFKSHYAVTESKYDYNLLDVLLASTAAPTYFPLHSIAMDLYADGGLVANNPTLCAITEAMSLWPGEELSVLSLGTGIIPTQMDGARTWGTLGWIEPLVDVFFDDAAINHEICELKPKNYWRIQANVPTQFAMDAANQIPAMESFAQTMIIQNISLLDSVVSILKAP